MQLPPLSVIETWPQPNYINPTDVRGPTIIILTAIFLPLLVIVLTLRIYTRLHFSKNFGADDIAIIAAAFPTVACAIMALIAVLHFGWSRHVWDVPADQFITGLEFVIAVEILFVTGASLTKVSMLLLINRIMASGSVVLKRLSLILMIIVCTDCVIYLIVAVNTCSPVSAYWTLSSAPQNCINEAAHLLAGGIINTLTDFCVVLLPIPVVLNLNLPLRQKIACAMLFGAGFIVCIAAGVRMSYTWQLNNTYDKTWLAYPVWIAGTIELYLGIIATSIPAIKPLISWYFPNMLGGNFSKYGQPSLLSNAKNADQHIEMGTSATVSSEPSEQFALGKTAMFETVTTITGGTTSKLEKLAPPMSTYSTYKKSADKDNKPFDWSQSRYPWDVSESSKSSLNSLEAGTAGWQPVVEEESRLAAPKHEQKVESRDVLVGTAITQ